MKKTLLIIAVLWSVFSCKKENAGFDFEAVEIPENGTVRAINFINDQWIISGGNTGSKGFIITTSNAFDQFELISDSLKCPVYDQDYINNRYVFSADTIDVYYGNDELSKITVYYPHQDYWVNTLNKKKLWQIEQTPNMGVYMAGGGEYSKGLIFYSPIGNNQWIPYELDHEMRGVSYQPPHTIWACGYGLLIKTQDFNLGWEIVPFYNEFFTGIDFLDENTGLLSTFDGKIYRTSTGGNNWEKVFKVNGGISGLSINKIKFINDRLAIAFGNGGFLAISKDRGKTWQSGSDFDETDLYDAAFMDGWLYLAGNTSKIYKLIP